MTTAPFDWSRFESAYGSAADVPARVLAARSLRDVDDLRQELGEFAVFGLDGGYLTQAASALVASFLGEALAACTAGRPAWPYLAHVLAVFGAGRAAFGIAPARFFSPHEAEATRVTKAWERERRQREAAEEVSARAPLLLVAAQSASGRDAVHLIGCMNLASALGAEDIGALAASYKRAENDAQRASLLVPYANAVAQTAAPGRDELFARAFEAPSPYLRAAAWAAGVCFLPGAWDVPTGAELEGFVSAANRWDQDFVWYEGLLGGVVCQAVARSRLARSDKLRALLTCLERPPAAVPEPAVPLASTGAAAAWELFELVFASHYQRRRPLAPLELDDEQREVLSRLRACSSHWVEVGHEYPSQFGIFDFTLAVDALLACPPALERRLGAAWPGELEAQLALALLLRPLAFPRASDERSRAFSLTVSRLLDGASGDELRTILAATLELPGYPCRELALALHHEAAGRARGSDAPSRRTMRSFETPSLHGQRTRPASC